MLNPALIITITMGPHKGRTFNNKEMARDGSPWRVLSYHHNPIDQEEIERRLKSAAAELAIFPEFTMSTDLWTAKVEHEPTCQDRKAV